jgi:hypothetical protein
VFGPAARDAAGSAGDRATVDCDGTLAPPAGITDAVLPGGFERGGAVPAGAAASVGELARGRTFESGRRSGAPADVCDAGALDGDGVGACAASGATAGGRVLRAAVEEGDAEDATGGSVTGPSGAPGRSLARSASATRRCTTSSPRAAPGLGAGRTSPDLEPVAVPAGRPPPRAEVALEVASLPVSTTRRSRRSAAAALRRSVVTVAGCAGVAVAAPGRALGPVDGFAPRDDCGGGVLAADR